MACIDDGEPPPQELKTAWLCERWGALPETGAMYDQDASRIYIMTSLSNIYGSMSRLRNAHGAAIHNLSDQDRSVLKMLVDMGLIFNG